MRRTRLRAAASTNFATALDLRSVVLMDAEEHAWGVSRALGHVPALDGVRGVAILLVVGRHYKQTIPGGGLGVDLFFVLSGFLITALLLRERATTGRVSLRGFYRRRAFRLLPALFTLLAFYVGCAAAAGHFGADTPDTAYRAAGLAATYSLNVPLAAGMDGGSISHLWSLALEEQFYLLWPLLLLVLIARRTRPHVIVGLLVAAAAAVMTHRWGIADTASSRRLWVSPDMHADALLLGCAAAVVYTHQLWRRHLTFAATAALPAAAAVVAVYAREDRSLYGWPLALFMVCSAVVVLAVASDPRSPLARVLSFRPLAAIGIVSYGLYLWHFPIFMLLGPNPAALVLAVLVTILSYRYVERPFLRRKRVTSPASAERPWLARTAAIVQNASNA